MYDIRTYCTISYQSYVVSSSSQLQHSFFFSERYIWQ